MAREDGAALSLGEWDRLEITERPYGARFSVHVRPRSSRTAVLGVREGAVDVALTSPPADGAANAELLQLLAKVLSVRKGDLVIAVGLSSRSKLIDVNGVSADEARERLQKAKR